MSTGALPVAGDQANPLKPGDELTADSGLKYEIKAVLKEHPELRLYVYRARAQEKDYVVKNVPNVFDHQIDLQKRVATSPNIRTVVDTVRRSRLLIFPFLASDLLHFRHQPGLSQQQKKDIVRQALCGLVDLHRHDILHNDIKPNNIVVDYEQAAGSQPPQLTVTAVQISDLDDAVIVPPGKYLRGPLCGNQFWRSPESWARSAQNQASDVFSFGIVAIYIMLGDMVFFPDGAKVNRSAEEDWHRILSLHISYFGDQDGVNGLLDHLGEENPFTERIIEVVSPFRAPNTRAPFQGRHGVDVKFRDLVSQMTNLAPALRITAREALEHEWFKSERTAIAPEAELEAARVAYESGQQS